MTTQQVAVMKREWIIIITRLDVLATLFKLVDRFDDVIRYLCRLLFPYD